MPKIESKYTPEELRARKIGLISYFTAALVGFFTDIGLNAHFVHSHTEQLSKIIDVNNVGIVLNRIFHQSMLLPVEFFLCINPTTSRDMILPAYVPSCDNAILMTMTISCAAALGAWAALTAADQLLPREN